MRETRNKIYRNKYIQLINIFICLGLDSHEQYYFNILRIIALLHHLCIEQETYEMSYLKNHINENTFIINTMIKWDYFITFDAKFWKIVF